MLVQFSSTMSILQSKIARWHVNKKIHHFYLIFRWKKRRGCEYLFCNTVLVCKKDDVGDEIGVLPKLSGKKVTNESSLYKLFSIWRVPSLSFTTIDFIYFLKLFCRVIYKFIYLYFRLCLYSRYMPSYMYPYKMYPYYLSGVGYFMSTQVALKLYEEAFSIPIIHMEDVYITGMLFQPWLNFLYKKYEM